LYAFNEETLRYLLEKIKTQLDKKKIVEYFLEESDEENALIIGEDEIDEALVEKSGFPDRTKVLIKEMVLTEVEFTAEEKRALNTSITDKSSDNILEDWMGNLFFDLITYEEYNFRKFGGNADFDLSKFYIVSDNIEDDKPATIVFIDKYITRDNQIKNFIDNKVDVDGDKVLSEEDFTDERKAIADGLMTNIDSILTNDSIKDNLETAEGVLSANQGRILKDEYCGGEPFDFYLPEDEVYGLTDAQVAMLNKSYSNTLFNKDMTFAKRKEILDARKGYDSLSERINVMERRLKTVAHNIDFADNVSEYYGVHVDFEDYTFTRLGKARKADFNECYPWAGMRRCNIVNGEVVAYENDENYREDGSNGDVMVEIPKFWYKVEPIRLGPVKTGTGKQILEAKWFISSKESMTYKVHPAFIRNGVEVDFIYVGAFEACLFSASANDYLRNNEQTMNSDTDKLCSISGALPATGVTQMLTMNNCRRLASNKGANYELYNYKTHAAIQLLFLIEHASFNSQEFSYGLCEENSSHYLTGYEDAAVYRGIENLWGNIHEFTDGAYFSGESFKFSVDNQRLSNFTIARGSAISKYIGYDELYDYIFIPVAGGASSVTGLCDSFYGFSTPQYGCFIRGGLLGALDNCGLWGIVFDVGFPLSLSHTDSGKISDIGTRVMFYK
jgi:hypothetical protein